MWSAVKDVEAGTQRRLACRLSGGSAYTLNRQGCSGPAIPDSSAFIRGGVQTPCALVEMTWTF
jgi:hypothetical protein